MPERVARSSPRSPGHQYRHTTTEDLAIPHADFPVVKSVEDVRGTETLPDAGIFGSGIGSRVGSPDCGRQDQFSAGTSSLSRVDVAGSVDRYPSPSSLVQPFASSPDLPIHPDIYVPTRGRLITDQIIPQIEETAGADGDGTNSIDHLPRDAAQIFVDTAYEVRLDTASFPRHAV